MSGSNGGDSYTLAPTDHTPAPDRLQESQWNVAWSLLHMPSNSKEELSITAAITGNAYH